MKPIPFNITGEGISIQNEHLSRTNMAVECRYYFMKPYATFASIPYNSPQQVETIAFQDVDLGQVGSKECSIAVFSMPKLQTLEFNNVKFDHQFFLAMADCSKRSQVNAEIVLLQNLSSLHSSLTQSNNRVDNYEFI